MTEPNLRDLCTKEQLEGHIKGLERSLAAMKREYEELEIAVSKGIRIADQRAESAEARVKELDEKWTRTRDTLQAMMLEYQDTKATLAQRDEALATARRLLEQTLDAINQDAWTVLTEDIRSALAPAPAPERSGEAPRESWAEATSRKAGPNPEPSPEPAPKADGPFSDIDLDKLIIKDPDHVLVVVDDKGTVKTLREWARGEDAPPDAVKQVVGEIERDAQVYANEGRGFAAERHRRWASTLSAALEAK